MRHLIVLWRSPRRCAVEIETEDGRRKRWLGGSMQVAMVSIAFLFVILGCEMAKDAPSAETPVNAVGVASGGQQARPESASAPSGCKPPDVKPLAVDFSRCDESTGLCLKKPLRSQLGYFPKFSKPLANPKPAQILTLSDPGSTAGGYVICSGGKGANCTGGARYGMNELGGGYGIQFMPPGEGNIAREGYGDGWQSDLRDGYHNNDWNPTQAGSAWSLGTQADVKKTARGYRIGRYNMANFINDNGPLDPNEIKALHRDFVEDDTINSQAGRNYESRIVNGKDMDDCKNETLDQEVRSEFDFQGEVEDVKSVFQTSIPTFRFRNQIDYARSPSVVMQFLNPKNPKALSTWLDDRFLMNISPALFKDKVASKTDISFATYTWGVRIKEGSKYKHFGSKRQSSDAWDFIQLKTGPNGRTRQNVTIKSAPLSHLKSQFRSGVPAGVDSSSEPVKPYAVLADGTDQLTSKAIAIYYPTGSPTNRFQTVGMKNGKAEYAEDRLLSAIFMGVAVPIEKHKDGYNLLTRVFTNGLLEPRRTPAGVVEALRSEVFVLYGTLSEIDQAVAKIASQVETTITPPPPEGESDSTDSSDGDGDGDGTDSSDSDGDGDGTDSSDGGGGDGTDSSDGGGGDGMDSSDGGGGGMDSSDGGGGGMDSSDGGGGGMDSSDGGGGGSGDGNQCVAPFPTPMTCVAPNSCGTSSGCRVPAGGAFPGNVCCWSP